MNGSLIPDTPIAVDYWRTRNCPQSKLFFLTHMHADHTSGLSPSWKHTIYCSEISAKLLVAKFHVNSSLVKVLEVGVSHVINLDEVGQETMTVTPIDANHCPGSVIYLFEGYFGKILYTGDFRYSPEMFVDTPLSNQPTIDVLYLDNTYNNPKCDFPSREKCSAKLIDTIKCYPKHHILLGMHTLGKENLLVDIARSVQEWIVISESRYKTMELLEMPDVFTTRKEDGRIHVTSHHQITKKNLERLNNVEKKPTIGILPTALYTGLTGKPYANQPNVAVIPYSDHSSYREMTEFVSRIKPRKIIPIVRDKSFGAFGASTCDHANLDNFKQYLDHSPMKVYEIPPTVSKYMKSADSDYSHGFPEISDKITIVKKLKRKSSSRKMVEKGVVFSDSPEKLSLQIRNKSSEDEHDKKHEESEDTTFSSDVDGHSILKNESVDRLSVPKSKQERKLPTSVKLLAQQQCQQRIQSNAASQKEMHKPSPQPGLSTDIHPPNPSSHPRKLPTGLVQLSQLHKSNGKMRGLENLYDDKAKSLAQPHSYKYENSKVIFNSHTESAKKRPKTDSHVKEKLSSTKRKSDVLRCSKTIDCYFTPSRKDTSVKMMSVGTSNSQNCNLNGTEMDGSKSKSSSVTKQRKMQKGSAQLSYSNTTAALSKQNGDRHIHVDCSSLCCFPVKPIHSRSNKTAVFDDLLLPVKPIKNYEEDFGIRILRGDD